jgi:hypothetical protein
VHMTHGSTHAGVATRAANSSDQKHRGSVIPPDAWTCHDWTCFEDMQPEVPPAHLLPQTAVGTSVPHACRTVTPPGTCMALLVSLYGCLFHVLVDTMRAFDELHNR